MRNISFVKWLMLNIVFKFLDVIVYVILEFIFSFILVVWIIVIWEDNVKFLEILIVENVILNLGLLLLVLFIIILRRIWENMEELEVLVVWIVRV